jgi:hypothetical protein
MTLADNNKPLEFLKRMDAGEFDGTLSSELKKLSDQQLSDVAKVLMDRDDRGEQTLPDPIPF